MGSDAEQQRAEDLSWLEGEAGKWQETADRTERRARASKSDRYRQQNAREARRFRDEVDRLRRIIGYVREREEFRQTALGYGGHSVTCESRHHQDAACDCGWEKHRAALEGSLT